MINPARVVVASDKAEVTVFVKDPTILVVDNYVPHDDPFLNEIATDKLVAEILRDWSWAEWDVAAEGYPAAADLAAYTSVIWYVDEGAGEFYEYMHHVDSTDYVDNPLDDYLDAGNNLWLMGSEILYVASAGITTWGIIPTTAPDTLAESDTTSLPISGSLAYRGVDSNTVSIDISLTALGDTTWGMFIDSSFIHIDSVVTVDTTTYTDSTVYDTTYGPADTVWTASTYTETVTDAANTGYLMSGTDTLGSISYSSGAITIDTLLTDLTDADLIAVDLIVAATGYTHKYQGNDIFDADKFFGEYIHVARGSGDAGGTFTGLASVGEEGFPEIGIPGLATGTGWPDELVPVDEAATTAIYDLGGYDAGTTAGVLYEGTYNVVFWGVNFAFVATNGNHLTLAPVDMYPVANHVLKNIFSE